MPEDNQIKWVGVRPTSTASLTSAQLSIDNTDNQILAAKVTRNYALIKNISSTDVYVRPAATITTSNGELLKQGDFAIYKGYTGQIRGRTAAGSATIYYEED